ncbi:2-succinyl-5-enolpyruvyl-6-hydroxy-3-cyclohexene-1-carboxylate synthase [Nocardioides sp. Root190]|uniref:2-succinyl-5-enolpyruvyl-6-hydroxy-3- cyclohexene-1-carboxylic-acid synthase n=1 Tax=Nocardioides sp. Root190 TaxID=1736488 RepID=UPI0006F65BCA|nr:2-succinyl-5-enolpyruvyl-6-hydroxy-3-cyclohexene-1-carboxylic-acid synthase [Nocardioides sp. Root190]KRB80243.1 2-succinyl-5-enolpyruvyl-6-hydroxy-3-cyclohexene-1-carboxylate synthase [Nocardioides sp. Root190]
MTTSAAELGEALVGWLARAGVTDVVVAPGSRNAPLSMALWSAEQGGGARLHVRIDERSAGFLALGLSKARGRGSRAAVVTTSGTAVANVHPAVLEAVHSGVGLVVVSADRPARLRGRTTNQTTDQVGIFGALVPSYDVATLADLDAVPSAPGSVVHLNVQLDVPLVPDTPLAVPSAVVPGQKHPGTPFSGAFDPGLPRTELEKGPRTVVVAGDDAGPQARQLAEAAGWPLLAEPTSGSRTGDLALRTYRLLLGTDLGARIERVVVFGRPTISRPVASLLENPDVEVLVVPAAGIWPVRPPHSSVVEAPWWAGDQPDDPAWLGAWRDADQALGRRIDRLLSNEPVLTAYDVAAVVHAALPADGLLFVGASSPVRDLDLMARPTPVGSHRKVIANRGLAGIDGTLSTAIGAALGRSRSARNLLLVGDLTFLHDQGALVIGPDEPRPDLTIVVANDDGGAIFAGLEQGAPAHAASFERLFGTPHRTDLASLCAASRIPHLRVGSRPELEQALGSPNGGIEVVEATISRAGRRDLDARIRDLATDPGQ